MAGQHPVQQTTHLRGEHPGRPLDPHSSPLLQVRPAPRGSLGAQSVEGPECLGPLSPNLCSNVLTPLCPPSTDHVLGCGQPNETLDRMSCVRHPGSEQRVLVTKLDLFQSRSNQIPCVRSLASYHSLHRSCSHRSPWSPENALPLPVFSGVVPGSRVTATTPL